LGNVISLLANFFEDLLRGISGPLGIRLRRAWYQRRLGQCGSNLTVEAGVHFIGPEHIELGDSVWIDRNVVLIAGPPREAARIVARRTADNVIEGKLRIGDASHLGIGTIIQAHGGVTIGDYFTSSAGVKIYSYSNDPATCRQGTLDIGGGDPTYILTPVEIGQNVWLGLDAVLIGHRIGRDSFVMPKSVVTNDIDENTVSGGNPALFIRARFQNGKQ
jgi:acetyltransferase-like isoleucine patch superfamily enzyme